jgi:hypothetical protein
MANVDPRLADMTLLVLAAKRRLATRQTSAWEHTEGLWSLLQAAKALPRRDPWSLPSVEGCDGMARLLAEARQWQKEHAHGA